MHKETGRIKYIRLHIWFLVCYLGNIFFSILESLKVQFYIKNRFKLERKSQKISDLKKIASDNNEWVIKVII